MTPVTGAAIGFALAQSALFLFAVFAKLPRGTRGLFLAYPRLVGPAACLIAQLAFGLASAVFLQALPALTAAVEIILLAASAVLVLAPSKAMEAADAKDGAVAESTCLMRGLLLDLEGARDRLGPHPEQGDGTETSKALDRLIDDVRYSDPVSGPATRDVEERLKSQIAAVTANPTLDGIRQASLTLADRNRRAKGKP